MNKLSVFCNCPFKWYKFRETIPWFFRSFKCAYQRITKGFCFRDIWNIDLYLLELLPQIFDSFRENTSAYPSDMTEEEWNNYLIEMAESFRKANVENDYGIESSEEQDDNLVHGFEMLIRRFRHLWD